MKKPQGKAERIKVIYPFFLAAFPVFSLYYYNVSEVLPWVFIKPLVASVLLVAAIFGATKTLLKNWHKAGLLTAFILLVIFSHGHIHNLIGARFSNLFSNGPHDFGIVTLGIDDILFLIW